MNKQDEYSGVLIIYTGGTLGSIPKSDEPNSPLIPLSKEDVNNEANPIFSLIPGYNSETQRIDIGEQNVMLHLRSINEPIDSSNVSLETWREILDIVKTEYNNYEGFVILHGTDTMTYTASALSFMMNNLNKPVIITGSQKPIGLTRSDAVQNLVTAIEITSAKSLGKTVVPEVCIFFRNKLLRGCRTIKFSTSNYEAFQSPNFPELGNADEYIVINDNLVRRKSPHPFQISSEFEPKVMCLNIAPGMDLNIIRAIITSDNLEGIILLTYGTGNAPTLPCFLDIIDESIMMGKIIVNITQCVSGEVEPGLYDTSSGLVSRGVIGGLDMTTEAAYTKLCYLLGLGKEKDEIKDLVQINLRGEQTLSVFNLHFGSGEIGEQEEFLSFFQMRKMVDDGKYNSRFVYKALLIITGITEPDGGRHQSARGKVFIDLEGTNSRFDENSVNYLGSFDRRWNSEGGTENIFMTITEQAQLFIDNEHLVSITIMNENGRKLRWKKMQISIFSNV